MLIRRHALRAAFTSLVPLALLGVLTGPADAAGAGWPEPAPVITRVETKAPVVFITIDDGWTHDAAAAKLLLERHVPASLFLLPGAYSYDAGYFHQFLDQGPSRVENHTVDHPDLRQLDEAGQRAQICGARDADLAEFGDSPRLMRPPFGFWDETTRTVARACGAKAVVGWTHDLTTWTETPAMPELKAGDIILLHFTGGLEQDLRRVLDAAGAAGLKPAPLRDYIRD
ncbi:hypothetical protein SRB5_60130 [Streptomyces sp. RB5]|uniref:NodB homology domain-containing protein n=1 Tax=Streptomyces smaragdinus TaxID=2585196 RepID=A0A7K0CS45_9ACTN|nr:polysaccharide deacetylase family protein [Streptomyces smaragdinus]MQY15822.1 hypothetical protein [Streptomyces smaragdinus]